MERRPPKIDVEYECWKRFTNIFSDSKYCGICLTTQNVLCELEAEYAQISAGPETDALSLKEILFMLFGNSTQNLIHSGFICKTCKDSAINSCVFIHRTKHNADIFDHYLRQLDSKIDQVYKHCDNQLKAGKSENALIIIEKPMKTVQLGTNLYSQPKIRNNPRVINGHDIGERPLSSSELLQADDDDDDDDMGDDNQNINDLNINTISLVSDLDLRNRDARKPTKKSIQRKQNVENSDNENFACNICHKSFRKKDYLRVHKLRQHVFGSRKRDFSCLVCQFKCVDITGLRAHMLTHDANKKYTCEICSVEFDSRRRYIQHAKGLIHRAKLNPKISEQYKIKQRNLKCSICQIKIANNMLYHEHMRTHGPDEKHKCTTCDMEFDSRRKYLLHTKSVPHLQLSDCEKIKCNYCNYTSYLARAMKVHFQKQHLEMPLHECFICKKKLRTKTTLRLHIKRHSVIGGDIKEKAYRKACEFCGKIMGGPTAMKKHIRLHTGERPYQCHLCDMGYVCKSELTMHIYRKHTEKSVDCPLCDVQFHTISNMRLHVKKCHWKSDEKFDFRKLEGLSEADYALFQDRRKVNFSLT